MRKFRCETDINGLDLSGITTVLQDSYCLPPWNEDKICPQCKPLCDFGPEFVYGISHNNICDICESRLVRCWSEERIKLYLELAASNPDFIFLESWENECKSGWLWGYRREDSFYIDVYAVMPEFRTAPQSSQFSVIKKASFCSRRHDYQAMESFSLVSEIPTQAALFLKLITLCKEEDYRTVLTRTHSLAINVHNLLKLAGFVFKESALEDKERQYWHYQL